MTRKKGSKKNKTQQAPRNQQTTRKQEPTTHETAPTHEQTKEVLVPNQPTIREEWENSSIEVSTSVIGVGATTEYKVYKGKVSIEVAVRETPLEWSEIQDGLARQNFIHENILGQHGIKFNMEKGVIYQAMEFCEMNLATYILNNPDVVHYGRPTAAFVSLLRDIVHGVTQIHIAGGRCKNLKPTKIFVRYGRIHISPEVVVTQRDPLWLAPEECIRHWDTQVKEVENSGRRADIYRLGMVLYYCLTLGKRPPPPYALHKELERLQYEAQILIGSLLHSDYNKRPSVVSVHNPLFWLPKGRLQFIADVSDVAMEQNAVYVCLRKTKIFGRYDDWRTVVDKWLYEGMVEYLREKERQEKEKYEREKGKEDPVKKKQEKEGGKEKHEKEEEKPKEYYNPSDSSLMRFKRNVWRHYHRFPKDKIDELKAHVKGEGGIMEGIDWYFESKFPTLLMCVRDSLIRGGLDKLEILSEHFKEVSDQKKLENEYANHKC